MNLGRLILAINRWPPFANCFRVKLSQGWLVAPSLDRLLYLLLLRCGIMGRAEARFLKQNIRTGMTVVDVGANVGVYTLMLSRLVGDSGRVIAFEPDPFLFAALQKSMALNRVSNVEARPFALGAQSGVWMLKRSSFNSGDNRVEPQASSSDGQCEVAVRTVDEQLSGQAVDFVKIDVQGREIDVFRGMADMLAAGTPEQIYFELWPKGCRDAGYEALELTDLLISYGYEVRPVGHSPLASRREWESFVAGMSWAQFTDVEATKRSVSE